MINSPIHYGKLFNLLIKRGCDHVGIDVPPRGDIDIVWNLVTRFHTNSEDIDDILQQHKINIDLFHVLSIIFVIFHKNNIGEGYILPNIEWIDDLYESLTGILSRDPEICESYVNDFNLFRDDDVPEITNIDQILVYTIDDIAEIKMPPEKKIKSSSLHHYDDMIDGDGIDEMDLIRRIIYDRFKLWDGYTVYRTDDDDVARMPNVSYLIYPFGVDKRKNNKKIIYKITINNYTEEFHTKNNIKWIAPKRLSRMRYYNYLTVDGPNEENK